jgi:hypothetical protein
MPVAPFGLGRKTTVDIYHPPNAPPNTPDVSAATLWLQGWWRNIKVSVEYTHIGFVSLGVDVHDGDNLYVPGLGGANDATQATVFTIAKLGRTRGIGVQDMKMLLLQREQGGVPWPTQNI